MTTQDTTPLTIKLEVEQRSGEWTATYVVGSDLYPKGKGEARVDMPQSFMSREEAVQHGVHEFAAVIGQQIGAHAR